MFPRRFGGHGSQRSVAKPEPMKLPALQLWAWHSLVSSDHVKQPGPDWLFYFRGWNATRWYWGDWKIPHFLILFKGSPCEPIRMMECHKGFERCSSVSQACCFFYHPLPAKRQKGWQFLLGGPKSDFLKRLGDIPWWKKSCKTRDT